MTRHQEEALPQAWCDTLASCPLRIAIQNQVSLTPYKSESTHVRGHLRNLNCGIIWIFSLEQQISPSANLLEKNPNLRLIVVVDWLYVCFIWKCCWFCALGCRIYFKVLATWSSVAHWCTSSHRDRVKTAGRVRPPILFLSCLKSLCCCRCDFVETVWADSLNSFQHSRLHRIIDPNKQERREANWRHSWCCLLYFVFLLIIGLCEIQIFPS